VLAVGPVRYPVPSVRNTFRHTPLTAHLSMRGVTEVSPPKQLVTKCDTE
jgi:hypothetical protein